MTVHYKEYAYPSVLMGEKMLTINTDMLLQTGSLIMVKLGKIRAGQWIAKALRLLESHKASSLEVSVGLKFGIKNHVSGLINSTMQTSQELQQIADGENCYAAINAGIRAYNMAVNVVGLASGSPISIGGWISGGASFDQLEAQIDGDIRGELEIDAPKSRVVVSHIELSCPQEEVSSKNNFTSIGFEIGKTVKSKPMSGVSISHWQQEGQWSMGFSGHYSAGRGGAVSASYGDKDGNLDLTYQPVSLEELRKAFNRDGIKRIRKNVSSAITDVSEIVSGSMISLLDDDFSSEGSGFPAGDLSWEENYWKEKFSEEDEPDIAESEEIEN